MTDALSESISTSEAQSPEPMLFEGQPIDGLYVSLPTVKVEVDQAYARGTYLTIQVEYRVRNVRMEEDRKGVLSRIAVLVPDGAASIVAIESAEDHLASTVVVGEYPEEPEESATDAPGLAEALADDWEYPASEGESAPVAEVVGQSVEEIFA